MVIVCLFILGTSLIVFLPVATRKTHSRLRLFACVSETRGLSRFMLPEDLFCDP